MRFSIVMFLMAACVDSGPTASCQPFGTLVSQGALPKVSVTGIESDPSVLHEGGTYKMWFTTANRIAPANLRTAYAESSDGITWHEVTDTAITPGTGFDAAGVETVSVVHVGDRYIAYYTGDEPPDGSLRYSIGRATSPDGITWTRDENPVLPPQLAWEQPYCVDEPCTQRIGGTLEPSVLFDGTSYQMWYAALGVLGTSAAYRVGHATSADGITWTRDPDPVFTSGAITDWDGAIVSHVDVVDEPSGGFHLFYFGSSVGDQARCDSQGGCLLTPGSIGHAVSPDGVHWARDPDPVLRRDGFGVWSIGGPAALIDDGELKLWYFGTPAAQTLDIRLGFASAPCR